VKLREGDTNTEVAHIFEALYADDLVLFASSAEELQEMLDILDKIVTDFGQEISITKTKVMIVQMKESISRLEVPVTLHFFCKGQELEIVDKFKYLGGLDTEDAKMTEEIKVRGQRMRGAYAKYAKGIFQSTLKLKLKVNLFKAIVVMNGLFGCQVWNVTQAHVNELEAVHFTLLRRMLGKSRQGWGRGRLLEWAEAMQLKIYPLEWVMMKLQLRYAGHEIRVNTDQIHSLPHNMLFRGHIATEPRLHGGLEQAYPATLMRAVEMCGLTRKRFMTLAKDSKGWKRFLEESAVLTFMTGWYERENNKKQIRDAQRVGSLNRDHQYLEVDDSMMDGGLEEDLAGGGGGLMGMVPDLESCGESEETESEDEEGEVSEWARTVTSSAVVRDIQHEGEETQVLNEEAAVNFVHNLDGLVMQPRQEVRESFASKRKRMRTERSKAWKK